MNNTCKTQAPYRLIYTLSMYPMKLKRLTFTFKYSIKKKMWYVCQ